MAKRVVKFREKFELPVKLNLGKWFPRHMMSSMRHMQAKLRAIDLIIEVHDARIPFTGRNPNFFRLLCAIKPHVLVMNKVDLVDKMHLTSLGAELLRQNPSMRHVHWMSCVNSKRQASVHTLCDLARQELRSATRHHRALLPEYNILILGIPNVGKSSIINELRRVVARRKGKPALVGYAPGVTRSVMEKICISEDPRIYILDTPGIMAPELQTPESALKLALCHVVDDRNIESMYVADFLLFCLNHGGHFKYVDYFGLQHPTDDIQELLVTLCANDFVENTNNSLNLRGAAEKFIALFRQGKLGHFFLDHIDNLKASDPDSHRASL